MSGKREGDNFSGEQSRATKAEGDTIETKAQRRRIPAPPSDDPQEIPRRAPPGRNTASDRVSRTLKSTSQIKQRQMEADVKAKTRTSRMATKPGAVSVAGPQLRQMEANVKAKNRNLAPATRPGAVAMRRNQSRQIEADIISKSSSGVASTRPDAVSAADSQLRQKESDIVAKSRTGTEVGRTRPGAVSVSGPQLKQMEAIIDGKSRRGAAETKGGAVPLGGSQLRQMEADVMAKTRTSAAAERPGAVSVNRRAPTKRSDGSTQSKSSDKVGRELRSMEEDIKAKTRTSSAPVTPGVTSVGSRGHVKRLDSSAARRVSTNTPRRLHQMERDLRAKSFSRNPATTPGSVSVVSKEVRVEKFNDAEVKDCNNYSRAIPGAVKSFQDSEYYKKLNAKVEENEIAVGLRDKEESSSNGNFNNPAEDDEKHELLQNFTEPEDTIPKSQEFENNFDRNIRPPPEETRSIITTTDQGVAVAPEPEYGVTGISNVVGANVPDEGLAVATAIMEEDDVYYQNAIEYDPDSKPPLLSNRRFRLYSLVAIILCVLLTGLILGSIILLRGEPIGPSEAPSEAPSQMFVDETAAETGVIRDVERWIERFEYVSGAAVRDPTSVENRAARWIINEDPIRLEWFDSNLIQRFLLAIFYFDTTKDGKRPWRSCNKPKENETSSCVHLRFSRHLNDTIEYIPEEKIRWLSEEHECKWVGNVCDDNQVTRALNLVGQNMTGTLPTTLAEMPLLQSIRVSYNEFTGTFPSEFASMKQLLNLEIHGNKFSGTFPDEYFKTSSLQNLNIGDNLFTGTISNKFSKLSDLKGLHTFSNMFTGTIPKEIFQLSYLSFTRQSDNIFNGTVSSSIGHLTQVQEIWLSSNQLTGSIPTEVGLMANLIYFKLNWNKMEGTIPDELYQATYLKTLVLFSNYLNGTLSSDIGRLTDLEYLYVSRNELTGTIPQELSKAKLALAWLHMNYFVGSVPEVLCENNPEVLQADCFPRQNPPNNCSCCSACCNRNTELCLIIDDDYELEFG